MGMTRSGVALWGQFNAQSMTQQGSVDTKNAILSGLSRALRMGLQIAILGVGAWLVLNNEMTAGMIFAASIISGRALQPIDQVIGGWKHFTTTWRAWQSLKSVLATERADGSKTLLEAPSGRLSVEGAVVLGTDGLSKAPILNRISFDIEPGDEVYVGKLVLVMEAMKMEHAMKAPVDGVVGEIFYKIGDLVEGGAALLDFEASDYH